jgi:hypothetical protein
MSVALLRRHPAVLENIVKQLFGNIADIANWELLMDNITQSQYNVPHKLFILPVKINNDKLMSLVYQCFQKLNFTCEQLVEITFAYLEAVSPIAIHVLKRTILALKKSPKNVIITLNLGVETHAVPFSKIKF